MLRDCSDTFGNRFYDWASAVSVQSRSFFINLYAMF